MRLVVFGCLPFEAGYGVAGFAAGRSGLFGYFGCPFHCVVEGVGVERKFFEGFYEVYVEGHALGLAVVFSVYLLFHNFYGVKLLGLLGFYSFLFLMLW